MPSIKKQKHTKIIIAVFLKDSVNFEYFQSINTIET